MKQVKKVHNFQRLFHNLFCIPLHSGADQISGIYKALQIILFCPLDPSPDSSKIFPFMELPHNRGAKFIGNIPGHQKIHTLKNIGHIIFFNSNSHTILIRSIFDIHCYIVHKPLFHQPSQTQYIAAVGIQLDLITELFHFPDKLFDIRLKQRLASGNAHTIQNPLPFRKE